jgi:putative membrane protein
MMNYYYSTRMMPAQTFGFPWLGLVLNILFWILFIFVVVGLIRFFIHGGRNRRMNDEIDDEDSALGILKRRYAKGEITKKEFLEMKKDIS